MERLPVEFKLQWTAALRSGRYKQAQGRLKTDSGFCCLGVACDLVDPHTWRQLESYDSETDEPLTHEDSWITASGNDELPDAQDLPDAVIRALETPHGEDRVMDKLAEMNDGGKTFAELATWIEELL